MKTAEEIKKGLEICQIKSEGKKLLVCDPDECPYGTQSLKCKSELHEDAYSYIEQIEADKEHLGLLRAADAEAYRHKLHELEALVPRWISVEERLPEERTVVLVVREEILYGREVTIGWHRCGKWELPIGAKITHWMTLPDPPEVTKP